jgi:methionyl aminopeptidase
MIIQNEKELITYRAAAKLSVALLKKITQAVKPGVYPITVDNLAKKLCRENHVRPAFQGVANGRSVFDYATCICVNDAAVHAVPSTTIPFQTGDIVKLDFGLIYRGFYTDLCVTVAVGKFLNSVAEKLVKTAKEVSRSSIALAIPANTTGDIGQNMHAIARKNGFDVLKKYTGHGIGRTLHDQPVIPAHGQPKQGQLLKPNMVVCLEAQIVEKGDEVKVDNDGWTVRTVDAGLVGMFEYMVIVKDKPEVLTDTFDFPLVV